MNLKQVMKGYLDNPEATKYTVYPDGWLHTGDIAKYNENHQFFIVDRLKELIKVKGYQVRLHFCETKALKKFEPNLCHQSSSKDGEIVLYLNA